MLTEENDECASSSASSEMNATTNFALLDLPFLFTRFATRKEYKAYLESLSMDEYLQRFCYMAKTNHIVVDYSVFNARVKRSMDPTVANTFISFMVALFDYALETFPSITVHVNVDSFQMVHVERHYDFFWNISTTFQARFPLKQLNVCYIYNVPFLFSTLMSCIAVFIDKETKAKLKLAQC